MGERHKHYELILAWAEGAQIQFRALTLDTCWKDTDTPTWMGGYEYRIKPKKDVVLYAIVHDLNDAQSLAIVSGACPDRPVITFGDKSYLKLTFDGTTGKLKQAEVI